MELRKAGRIQAGMLRVLPCLTRCIFFLALGVTLAAQLVLGQDSSQPSPGTTAQAAGNPEPAESKRIFGIIPNFRTSPSLQNYAPLTTKQKFTIAAQDSFDRGTFVLAAAFAGESQLTNSDRSFGTGAGAYAHYYATSYADFMIGDFLTEAIYPTLLHQDPRYFRRGKGSTLSRMGYSVGQIFMTHKDSGGGSQFNYSEIVGNSTAVAISNAYYPETRDFTDGVTKLGTQLGVDLTANVLKEFWPDINRRFSRHRNNQ